MVSPVVQSSEYKHSSRRLHNVYVIGNEKNDGDNSRGRGQARPKGSESTNMRLQKKDIHLGIVSCCGCSQQVLGILCHSLALAKSL